MTAWNWAIDRGTLPLIPSAREFLPSAMSRAFRTKIRTQGFQYALYIQMAGLRGIEKEAADFGLRS